MAPLIHAAAQIAQAHPTNLAAWQRLPLAEVPLVFLDVETTGLNAAGGHRICELAMLREWHGTLHAAFETLLNPERDSEAAALAVHGLAPDQLAYAPLFADVAAQVLDLLSDAVLVAHNAPFDVSFLNHELLRIGHTPPILPVLDTLVLSRRLLRLPAYNLTALAATLGLHRPSHRAMADALTLRGLFAHLVERLAEDEQITCIGDILRFQRGLRPADPEPSAPPLIAQALQEQRRLRIIYRSRSTPEPIEREILPLELIHEGHGQNLRAYCFYRGDIRVFAIKKIEEMWLVPDQEQPPS